MGERVYINQDGPDPQILDRATRILAQGGVVIVPTDSVYGIACAATGRNPGLSRIFEIKRRDRSLTLPLLVDDVHALNNLADNLTPCARQLATAFWPGALTLVVKAARAVPCEYLRPDGTVALRMPNCTIVRELVVRLGCPLATTSANLHGKPAAASADELDAVLITESDLTLDGGPALVGAASSIVDVTGREPRMLREEAIPFSRIEEECRGR